MHLKTIELISLRTSKTYEILSIFLIIFLCCNNITTEVKGFNVINDKNTLSTLQIDHPKLLIGPMDGFCANHYSTQINPFISSYYTNSICMSRPLAPEGVLIKFTLIDGNILYKQRPKEYQITTLFYYLA